MGNFKFRHLRKASVRRAGLLVAALGLFAQIGCDGSGATRAGNDPFAADRVRVGQNTFINDGSSVVDFTGAVGRRRSFGTEPKSVVNCTFDQSQLTYQVSLYQPGEGSQVRRFAGAAEGVFLRFGRGESPETVRRINDATRTQVYAVLNTARDEESTFDRGRGANCSFSAQRRNVGGVDRLAGDLECPIMQNSARAITAIRASFDCRIRVVRN